MTAIISTMRSKQQQAAAALLTRVGGSRERGDVPGWVLITLMTAGLVTVLWAVAGDQLEKLFTDAIQNVVKSGGK